MGALPPSSSTAGLRWRAESSPMILPTRVEPVKFTRRTAGWAIRASTILGASAGAWVMTLTAPSGTPASIRHSPIRACTPGQISEAFITTVLPTASGTAIERTPRITGAFQGAMPSTTPAGVRMAIDSWPGLSVGMVWPVTWVVIEAASRSMPAAR